MTMTDYSAMRQRLEGEFRELLTRHGRISAHLRNEDREVPDDWTEMAQFMENDEVLEALEEHSREQLDAIRLAVNRIEEGTYGTCGSCDSAISGERLDLIPTAAVCAACA
ncbi:MAG: TraR/DksA family transcriptional regulator [Gemmatimonadota bacterium]|nr:TraR/DksA family transcriptional regulator [Gemmatimonadota bacterium]